MPETVALGIAFLVSNGAALVGASVSTQAILAGAVVSTAGVAVVGAGLSAGVSLGVNALLGSARREQNAPELPSAADGKVTQKQNVPPRVFIYGQVRRAGDLLFLEERSGTAYMVIAHASHEIEEYVTHYLSGSAVEIDANGYVIKSLSKDEDAGKYYKLNGRPKVQLVERTGAKLGVPFEELKTKFPELWSDNHRGDGVASVLMMCKSVHAQHHTTVYPSGFPSLSEVIKGKRILDPRDNVERYSENLALHYLDYLLAPYGDNRSLDEIDLAAWRHAAIVGDRTARSKNGKMEPLYHGGFWGRESNDPSDVKREIAEAADLLVYTNAEGRISVHPGEWVEPDLHIRGEACRSVRFISNRDKANTVRAVRGKWINPELDFNEDDAVIWGDPDVQEGDASSDTVDNECIQRHNHIRRIQKLRYIRKNAQRVKIVCDYFESEDLPYKRFIKITKQPQLDGAYVEIIGQPVFNFHDFVHEFEGIVVPSSMYDFSPDDEGEKGDPPVKIGSEAIPSVDDFTVQMIEKEGGVAARASFTRLMDSLDYQLEYVKTSGGTVAYVTADSALQSVETDLLVTGEEYRFRMRTRSVLGQNSDWSDVPVVAVASL